MAIIDYLTRLLQKVMNKRSSWSSTFSSRSWKVLWKICIKSSNWHLFLHKPKNYFITATKWAIIDFLTRLLQKVMNKRSSWSSTFSSLSWKILWKICIKSNHWHLFLHKLKRCIIMATKCFIIDSNLSSEDCDFECLWSEWSAGEMVSSESDQRLLGSEIGSDHSLIMVWTMVWFWVWTMVLGWSDQNSFGLESLIRTLWVWKVWSETISVWKVWSETISVWKVWSEIILVWKIWEANLGLDLNLGRLLFISRREHFLEISCFINLATHQFSTWVTIWSHSCC